MKLQGYRPIKTNDLSQEYGENMACARLNDNWTYSVKSINKHGICPPEYEPFYPLMGYLGHNGRDWGSILQEPLYHSWDFPGYCKTSTDSSLGLSLDVYSEKPIQIGDKFSFVRVRYHHNDSNIVKNGQRVEMGDLLGYSGMSGAATGPHCHETVKEAEFLGGDQYSKLKIENRYITKEKDNGYGGAIDPRPYQKNIFVGEMIEKFQGKERMIITFRRIFYNIWK